VAIESPKYSKLAFKKLASVFLGSNLSGNSCAIMGLDERAENLNSLHKASYVLGSEKTLQ